MAKIAVELDRALDERRRLGAPGRATARRLASGEGWRVADVLCTSGPRDRPFEEQHTGVSIAIVAAGTFQYRSTAGRALMTPGSLLLGSTGQTFECAHDHGAGDRCLSFSYAHDYFEQVAADAGFAGRGPWFGTVRLPPLRPLSPVIARAIGGLDGPSTLSWEEIGVELAARAIATAAGRPGESRAPTPTALARVTRSLRSIQDDPAFPHTVSSLAQQTRLSPFHFLRTFQQVAGVTPHQYLLRMRLLEAARRLTASDEKVLDMALDCGFADVSNFNRAFRTEFGQSPRAYRASR